MNSNQEKLKRNYNELIELKHVLEKDSVFFESSGGAERDRYDEEADVGSSEVAGLTSFGVKLGFVTGVVERSKMVTFERVLWRATRGNLFMRTAPIEERIEDPKTVRCAPHSRKLRRCDSKIHLFTTRAVTERVGGQACLHHLLPG
jgi:V-type H+-transporting ATPase subunit a